MSLELYKLSLGTADPRNLFLGTVRLSEQAGWVWGGSAPQFLSEDKVLGRLYVSTNTCGRPKAVKHGLLSEFG